MSTAAINGEAFIVKTRDDKSTDSLCIRRYHNDPIEVTGRTYVEALEKARHACEAFGFNAIIDVHTYTVDHEEGDACDVHLRGLPVTADANADAAAGVEHLELGRSSKPHRTVSIARARTAFEVVVCVLLVATIACALRASHNSKVRAKADEVYVACIKDASARSGISRKEFEMLRIFEIQHDKKYSRPTDKLEEKVWNIYTNCRDAREAYYAKEKFF